MAQNPERSFRIKFNPPVYGEFLYHFIKRAAAQTGYQVEEQNPDQEYSLNQLVYTLEGGMEGPIISARNIRHLTLTSKAQVSSPRNEFTRYPQSRLEFEVDLNESYLVVPCTFDMFDQSFYATIGVNRLGEISTPIHNFIKALHQEYKKGI